MKTYENYLKYDYSMKEESLDDDLTEAIIRDDIKFIKEYLTKYDVNRLIFEEFPILFLVNYDASIEIFKLFIDKGVNIEAQSDDENKTALLILSETSHINLEYKYSIIKLLIESGANINATTIKDENALLLSIENIRTSNKIQKLLIDYNIDINQQDTFLDTVLNSEIYNNYSIDEYNTHTDLILYLLNLKNIDLTIKDSDDNDFYDNLILVIEKLKKKTDFKKSLENILDMIKEIEYQHPEIYEKFQFEYNKYKKIQKIKKFNL
jgi:ankyrin repeat protein